MLREWDEEGVRSACVAGTEAYRDALVDAGLLHSPVVATPEPEPLPAPVSVCDSQLARTIAERDEALRELERLKQEYVTALRPKFEVARLIARKHEVSMGELRGPTRRKQAVVARQEAFWILSKCFGRSLPDIGRYFGNRDHTTVLHGVRRHEERMARGEV